MATLLEKLAIQHEARIKQVVEKLERKIIDDIAEFKKIIDIPVFELDAEAIRQKTNIAIRLRDNFKKEFQATILTEADSIIREYDSEVADFMKKWGKLKIPDQFKSLTKVNLEIINELKKQKFLGFEEVANKYLTEINANVYQNVIAGRSFEDMVKDLQGKLTGLEDRGGKPMSSHAGQLAHDSIMQFDGQFTLHKANEAGIDKFEYSGTLLKTSRKFCVEHINKIYTKKRIKEIWKRDWTGKAYGDAFIVRGGYNCRHHWLPVVDEE